MIEEYSETQKILEKMGFLSQKLSREIIKSLLKEKSDMRTLSRKLKKGRTSIFKTLKKMEKIGVVGHEKKPRDTAGRKMKVYFIKDIEIPRITRDLMKDVLDHKDIKGKYIETGELERVIDDLSRIRLKTDDGFVFLHPLVILKNLAKCGINITDSLRILIDIHGLLEKEKTYDQFVDDIIEYLVENKILSNEELNRLKNMFSRKLILITNNSMKTKKFGIEELQKVIKTELGLQDHETLLLSSNLTSFFREWESGIHYELFVISAYYLALKYQMNCKKPTFYDDYVAVKPPIDTVTFQVLIDKDTNIWNFEILSRWIMETFNTDLEIAKYIAFEVLERTRFLEFNKYSPDFMKTLCIEIMREHNLG